MRGWTCSIMGSSDCTALSSGTLSILLSGKAVHAILSHQNFWRFIVWRSRFDVSRLICAARTHPVGHKYNMNVIALSDMRNSSAATECFVIRMRNLRESRYSSNKSQCVAVPCLTATFNRLPSNVS